MAPTIVPCGEIDTESFKKEKDGEKDGEKT